MYTECIWKAGKNEPGGDTTCKNKSKRSNAIFSFDALFENSVEYTEPSLRTFLCCLHFRITPCHI